MDALARQGWTRILRVCRKQTTYHGVRSCGAIENLARRVAGGRAAGCMEPPRLLGTQHHLLGLFEKSLGTIRMQSVGPNPLVFELTFFTKCDCDVEGLFG